MDCNTALRVHSALPALLILSFVNPFRQRGARGGQKPVGRKNKGRSIARKLSSYASAKEEEKNDVGFSVSRKKREKDGGRRNGSGAARATPTTPAGESLPAIFSRFPAPFLCMLLGVLCAAVFYRFAESRWCCCFEQLLRIIFLSIIRQLLVL